MRERKIVRCGIVGAGFAASFHYGAIGKVYGTQPEVVGVFAADADQLAGFAAERGLKAFAGLDELLEQVDMVHVCVPPSAHEAVAVAALQHDCCAIVEKPLTGYFGDGSDGFDGRTLPKETARQEAMNSVRRLLAAEAASRGRIFYAENWVYAPSIQKEVEILRKTGGQILWIHGEESHSGSHAATYGYWKFSGGGSLIGKGCHPLTAALYLKRVEGLARDGRAIRPAAVSARTHSLTGIPGYIDQGHLRTEYHDVEDFCATHVTFGDGTVADIFASEIVHGGVHNWIEVNANNHRAICNINPSTAMQAYNPVDANFKDIYVVEKTGTKQGWSCPSPDEDWFTGYPQEIEAFYRAAAYGEPVESDMTLAADTIATIYAAYVSAEQSGADVEIELG